MAVALPLLSPLDIVVVSSRTKHESYSNLSEESIQGTNFSFNGLNLSNRTGAPNAIRWHTTPDLPPQFIIIQTEESTACPLSSSSTLLHKLSREKPCISGAMDVFF
jgi:hypothetical protein